MAGPEATHWVSRVDRELEPLQRSWQRFARDIEQASRTFVAARDKWRPLFEAWHRLSKAFVTARDRGDFRNFQIRLRLTVWMGQQVGAAKDNPSHRNARLW